MAGCTYWVGTAPSSLTRSQTRTSSHLHRRQCTLGTSQLVSALRECRLPTDQFCCQDHHETWIGRAASLLLHYVHFARQDQRTYHHHDDGTDHGPFRVLMPD